MCAALVSPRQQISGGCFTIKPTASNSVGLGHHHRAAEGKERVSGIETARSLLHFGRSWQHGLRAVRRVSAGV